MSAQNNAVASLRPISVRRPTSDSKQVGSLYTATEGRSSLHYGEQSSFYTARDTEAIIKMTQPETDQSEMQKLLDRDTQQVND